MVDMFWNVFKLHHLCVMLNIKKWHYIDLIFFSHIDFDENLHFLTKLRRVNTNS